MRQKIIAGVLALTLTSFAAVGAFASQDGGHGFRSLLSGGALNSDTTPTETSTATETATATLEATETATATPTDTATATVTGSATETATATATVAGGEEDERAIKGVPTTNPSHFPDDGDGECDPGETDVKTTPSGTQVNVPCQAADDHGQERDEHGNGGAHGHGKDDGDDDEGGSPTAEATATATP